MTDIRARVMDVLEEHFVVMAKCDEDAQEEFDAAVDALLSLPGIAIVELPEPPYDGLNIFKIGDKPMSPELARELAASMLAAAVQAQEPK